MRFHLIDRIDWYEPGRAIRARKHTSRNEPYWQGPPDQPVMPPALVLESLCQAGSWLLLLSTDLEKRGALLGLGSVAHLADVRPGAVLHLHGEVDSLRDDGAVFSGRVLVEGRPVLEARDILCGLLPAASLEDPARTAATMRLLLRQEGAA